MMEDYYTDNPDGKIPFRAPEDGWAMTPYKSFLLTRLTKEDFGSTAMAVERQEDGRYLVDWESFVGYSEMGWEDLLENKPAEPVLIRCRARVGDYYNFKFDQDTWACVQLQEGSGEHTIYGYMKIDGPVLKELAKVLPPRGIRHLTLRVAHAGEGTAKNQFLVTEVVGNGWVISDELSDPGDDEEAP